MKRLLVVAFICIFSLAGITAMAQGNRESVESAKVAFLNDKMALSPDQAQKFWPLYKEYATKRREIMSTRLHKGQDLDNLNEQQLRAMVDNMFERRQNELDLEKDYYARYQRVITPKQIVLLYRGEHEFTKLLLKKLDGNHGRARQE